MDKKEFDTLVGEDTLVKEQYARLIQEILDWNLSLAESTVITDKAIKSIEEHIAKGNLDVVIELVEAWFRLFGSKIYELLFEIIQEHSKNVFEGGINVREYLFNNADRVIGSQE